MGGARSWESSFLPGSRPLYNRNLGRGQRPLWEGLKTSPGEQGACKGTLAPSSLKRGLGQQRLGLESYQHQVEGGSDFLFFNQESVGKEEEMIFFLNSTFFPQKMSLKEDCYMHELPYIHSGHSLSCFNCVKCGSLCKFQKRPLWGYESSITNTCHLFIIELTFRDSQR